MVARGSFSLSPSRVQLLPCNRPSGTLESAPRTALRTDSALERWEGFWSVDDDGYYTRCIGADGNSHWYRIADEAARKPVLEARVLPLRPLHGREFPVTHRMLLLSPADGRRPILVGSSKRAPRAQSRGSAGDGR
jgi:hypothetical protein